MNSLFDTKTLTEIKNRIDNLSEETKPNWGKMNSGQMLRHCQTPFNIVNGTVEMKTKVGFMKKLVFKMMKSLMYNDKKWRHNVPTPKEFIVDYQVNFNDEKGVLFELIDDFHQRKDQAKFEPHPVFGKFKKDQWGKMQYKHLDHHLTQFGV